MGFVFADHRMFYCRRRTVQALLQLEVANTANDALGCGAKVFGKGTRAKSRLSRVPFPAGGYTL
jgi:hypothetical protein